MGIEPTHEQAGDLNSGEKSNGRHGKHGRVQTVGILASCASPYLQLASESSARAHETPRPPWRSAERG